MVDGVEGARSVRWEMEELRIVYLLGAENEGLQGGRTKDSCIPVLYGEVEEPEQCIPVLKKNKP